jgi:hypothetical protein
MSRSSSGDQGEIHPYMRSIFYTRHWFSTDMRYTEKARKEFRNREIEEQKRLLKQNKVDSIIYRNN